MRSVFRELRQYIYFLGVLRLLLLLLLLPLVPAGTAAAAGALGQGRLGAWGLLRYGRSGGELAAALLAFGADGHGRWCTSSMLVPL